MPKKTLTEWVAAHNATQTALTPQPPKGKTGAVSGMKVKILKAGSYSDDTQLMLSVARAISEDGAINNQYFSKIEFICLGIFYGFILTMIIYNLILFFSTKDKVYPLYIGLLIMGTIRTLAEDRMGGLYLWRSNQELSYILGIYIAPNAILIFYMLFTFNYLKIKP